jgi:hypothetical protein
MSLQLIEGEKVHPILDFKVLSKAAMYDLVALLEKTNFFNLYSKDDHDLYENAKLTLTVKLDDIRNTRHSLTVNKYNIPENVHELYQFVRSLYHEHHDKPHHSHGHSHSHSHGHMKMKKIKRTRQCTSDDCHDHEHGHSFKDCHSDSCNHDHDEDEEKDKFCTIL